MAVAVAEPETIWKPTLEELASRPVVIEVSVKSVDRTLISSHVASSKNCS